jgi:hypothetical protein
VRTVRVIRQIEANLLTCGKCEERWRPVDAADYSLCDTFDGTIFRTYGNRWLRLQVCRDAEVKP